MLKITVSNMMLATSVINIVANKKCRIWQQLFIFLIYTILSYWYWSTLWKPYSMVGSKLKPAKSVYLMEWTNYWNWSTRIDFDTFCFRFYYGVSHNLLLIKYERSWIIRIEINVRKFTKSYWSINQAISLRSKGGQPHIGLYQNTFLQ